MANELFYTPLFQDTALKGYWRLESNANDSSTSAYNLTQNNTPTYVTGQFGNAMHLIIASSQSASIADASCPNLEISGSQTWGAWIKPTALSQQSIMVKCPAGAANYSAMQIIDGSGHIQVFHSGVGNFSTTGVVTAGAWNFVVMRFDASADTLDCFINNVKESLGGCTGTVTDTNGDFAIGKFGAFATPYYFGGDIDEAWIFSRALSDDEITRYYNGTLVSMGFIL